jgi:hypothetical protein
MVVVTLKIITLNQMSEILMIKPATMHSKKWQKKSGCPLRKVGRKLFAMEQEFNDWLSDERKLRL